MDKKIEEKLLTVAIKEVGKPYKYGAKAIKSPKDFDCSSFVQYVYNKIGVELPRTSLEQAECGKKISQRALKIGDLLFFKGTVGRYNEKFPQGIGHVAMYIGNDKVIQAKYQKNKDGSEGGQVQIDPAGKMLKRKDLITIKRII